MNDLQRIRKHYLKNKSKILKYAALSFLFLLVAMAIIGFRVLHPYYFLFSMPFLFLSVRYAVSAFLIDRDKVAKSPSVVFGKKIFVTYKKTIFFVVTLGIIFYIFAQLFPGGANQFDTMKDDEVTLYVDQSVDVATLLLDNLETTGNELLSSGLLSKDTLTVDELEYLQAKWNEFLQTALDSETMTEVHRYFADISYFRMENEHAKSFTISYALYLKKYELFGGIISAVSGNDRVIKALNEYSSVFGAKNSYYDIRDRHVAKNTLLRRNFGRLYLWFIEKTVSTKEFGVNYGTLLRESKESYRYLITHATNIAEVVVIKYSNDVENGLFERWFPIQKNVANALGNIKVSSRTTTLISIEQVKEMKPFLLPGDIFVQRRNWYASNVGIPGFWPHSALHLGTLEEASIFFKDVFPVDGYASFSELVKNKYPHLYEKYIGADKDGYKYAVIEGLAPGIILQSLEKSAKADYIGVLRPRLSKEDKFKALLRAFENYGKPYDYNFDFETRDEIVCSELVYDAYITSIKKQGVSFRLSLTAGRKMLSPNDMVKKFYEERGKSAQELDFVYFIDGNESLGSAFVKDEISFSTTWTRPKFSRRLE